jgi:pimeloyl-ACP methyl ester carboxylesterase
VLALQNGPTVIAGHSYGGQVMTGLGTNAPNVVGLVYIAGTPRSNPCPRAPSAT